MRGALLSLLLLAGCDHGAPPEIDRVDAEAFIGRPLPDGTVDTQVEQARGIDRMVWLQFQAPRASAERYATELLGKPLEAGSDFGEGKNGTGPKWWLPPEQCDCRGGRADDEKRNRHYRLILEPIQDDMALVWLLTFET